MESPNKPSPLGDDERVAEVASEGNRPSERRMTFFEHLEELRQRLRIVIVVVIILFVLNLTTSIGAVSIGSAQVPMFLPALGPTSPNVATQFFLAMKNFLVPARVGPVPLNFSFKEPWDAYVVMFKVAFFLAAVTASPLIVYQVGRFVGPALKPTERRLILRVTVPVSLLFLSGVALCFVVILPFTFNLLFSVQNLLGANLLILYGDSFIDFVLLFTLAFGIAFQLPVLMYGLTVLGIVPANFWKKYWRFATIAIVIFGAIITPDGSGITMFLVALPMLALYVGGYVAARSVERSRARAKA